MGQLATAPERDRRSLVRRAARYGTVRSVAPRVDRVSVRERVIGPAATRIAAFMLRLNQRENLEQVQQKLLAAGLPTVAPSSYLAAKGALAAGGGIFGIMI